MERRDFFKLAVSGFAGLSVADQLAGHRLLAQAGVLKVTNLGSRITDAQAVKHLVRNGMAEKTVTDYVEFLEDYHRHPYAKIYRNRLTDERVLVSSGLPMSAGGRLITPRFERGAGHWYIGTNLMTGTVRDDGQITAAPIADQPGGRLAGQESRWKPRLYVGGVEQTPVSGPVLKDDLIAAGYATRNCIEWTYPACKRVVRVIQGRLQGFWEFAVNPGKDVRIAYEVAGWPVKLGPHATGPAEEYVPKAAFDVAKYPFAVMDSDTFYPDANPESGSVDGSVARASVNEAFATIAGGAGTLYYDSSGILTTPSINASTTSNQYAGHYYPVFVYDTSTIGAGGSVSAGTFSVAASAKGDNYSPLYASGIVPVATTTASNTALAAADYEDMRGKTKLATAITSAAWDVTGTAYNDFTLNASGLANINVASTSKFALPFEKVVDNIAPTWGNSKGAYTNTLHAENGSYKPKLVLTYTPGGGGSGPSSVAGVTNPTSVSNTESPTSVSGVQ